MESIATKKEVKAGKIYYVSRNTAKPKTNEERQAEARTWKHGGDNCGHYNGVFYTVGFRTDANMYIRGLSFMGPCMETGEPSKVSIRILQRTEDLPGFDCVFRCLWPCCGPYFRMEELASVNRMTASVNGKTGMLEMELPSPVYIEADKLTDIKFELTGPPTKRILDRATQESVVLEDSTRVTFDFLLGSRQLSGIHFSME